MASTSREPPDDSSPRFRWQTLFQHSIEPLFVLNRHRRILFVNRAWEDLMGMTLAEVKGQACRRRPRGILAEKAERVLSALTPPPEVIDGQPGQTRRASASPAAPGWWQVAFFPLRDKNGLLAILGKILAVPRPSEPAMQPLPEKLAALRQRHADQYRLDALIGDGPAMHRLREQIRLASATRLPVLLVGESGTGKHWTARAIHHRSAEREGAFASLDCARLPTDRIAEVLINADQASGLACIYLDGIDTLGRDIQERLRIVLESEVHTVRIIAGIVPEAQPVSRGGRILDDLFCRLSPLTVPLPPLRERMEDFEAWALHFLARAGAALDRAVESASPPAMELLRAHVWTRNLNELYDVMLGACRHAKGSLIEPGDLPFHLRQGPVTVDKPLALNDILQEVERRLIVQALRLAKNNKSRAAELLTVWRARLLRRIEALGIMNDGPEEVDVADEET